LLDLALPAALVLAVVATEWAARFLKLESTAGVFALEVLVPCALALLLLGRPVRFALGLLVLLGAASLRTRPAGEVLYARRDFFGVHKVMRVDRVLSRDNPGRPGGESSEGKVA